MMSKKRGLFVVMLFILGVSLTASAAVTDPNIITGIAKISSAAEEDLLVKNGGILTGELTHVDRSFVFADVNDLNGIDFVMTAVDDKANSSMHYQVTVDKSGTLMLVIDNRVGSGSSNDDTTPPQLGDGVMDWAGTNGFVETSYVVNVGESPFTAYAKSVTAGTYDLYEQNDGTSRMTYLVAGIPDGWNLPPSIIGVPASEYLSPGETLSIDATVTDYGENTTTTVAWTTVSAPAGAVVSYSPNDTSEDVEVSFSDLGDYTLSIIATDGDGLMTKKTVEVSVILPSFAIECTNWVEACNDTNRGPTSHFKPTEFMYVRNHAAPRRRIQLIQYDISGLKEAGEVFASSYLTLSRRTGATSEVLSVYGINEDLDNFDLDTGSWSNLPGVQNTPIPSMDDQITLASLDLADISELLLEATDIPGSKAELPWSDTGASAGLDEFLNADNDGTVLLLFVTFSPQDADFEIPARDQGNIEPVTGLGGIIVRGNMLTPTWATNPSPVIHSSQTTGLSQLSWVNPMGVGDITCDVYMGTGEPNSLSPDYGYTTLATGISDDFASLSSYTLTGETTYNWIVDVTDSGTGEKTRGYLWSFNAISNIPPIVEIADPQQYLWLNNAGDPASATATLDATVTDDGVPVEATLLWEQIDGPADVVIDPNNVEDITVVLPLVGTYTFKLTADDTETTASASAEIFVGESPCDAAQAKPGYVANIADFNDDCYVNLQDFSTFAEQWLDCNASMDAPCN